MYADEIESSDPLAAEEAYRRALEIDSTLAEAHLNLGRLLHADGKVEEALDEYRAARTIDGKDAVIHYNIGVASQDLGEFDDAVGAYERAIELAPRFAGARYNLSTLYEELGDTALAVQHLRAYRDLVEGLTGLNVEQKNEGPASKSPASAKASRHCEDLGTPDAHR